MHKPFAHLANALAAHAAGASPALVAVILYNGGTYVPREVG
jgi:hypothetical protein